jgi:drug/metabolite transporter (DMT)-like permease
VSRPAATPSSEDPPGRSRPRRRGIEAAPPTTARADRRAAYVLLVLLALVWGVHWPVVKAGLHELPPFTYGALRLASALLVVVAVLAARRELRLPPRADLGVILVVGLGQVAGSIVLINLALEVVPAGRSSVLAYTSPFWAALVMAAVLGTRIRLRVAAGILLGLLGVTILLNPTLLDWTSPGELVASLALLGSAGLTAVAVVSVRYHRWHLTPLQVQPWQLLAAFVPVSLLAAILETPTTLGVSPAAIPYVLYSGPLATAFAFWASQRVSRALDPTVTTMGMLATPVVGLVASSLLLGEVVSPLDLVGFFLTIGGIALVAVGDRRAGAAAAQPSGREAADGPAVATDAT